MVLRERYGLQAGTHVLEVGPGTGQVTRRLLDVDAVEPDRRLAEFLRERLGDQVALVEHTLEDAELEAGAFDLAVAASSFHWVDEPAGLASLRCALRPGGWINGRPSFGPGRRASPRRTDHGGLRPGRTRRVPLESRVGWHGYPGLYSTFSPIIALEPGHRKGLLDAVEHVAREDFGDRVEKPLVTSLYTARNPG